MDTVETLSATTDSAVKYVTDLQERVLDSVRNLAESFNKDISPTLATWFPAVEPARGREFVEESYAFNARLLELNKSFTIGLFDALAPESAPTKATKK